MVRYNDDFDYTGSLSGQGYTLAGVDPQIESDGGVATATGIYSFALKECDTNEQDSTIITVAEVSENVLVVICAPSGGGFSFPNIGGYALELVDPFASETWFWRLYRSGVEVIGYQGIGGTMPFEMSLAHDGAGNVDIYIDTVLVDTYVDGSPLTTTWAGFGTQNNGTEFYLWDAGDSGAGPPIEVEGAIGEWRTVGVAGVIEGQPVFATGAIGTWRTIGMAGDIQGGAPPAPGVWEQVAPVAVVMDPDDPTPGSNFGFQSMALADDGTVYVTADYAGLWRSTDHGDTWTHVSTDGDLESGTPWTLQIDPFDPDILWANSGYGAGGPLRSTDGGATWTLVSVGSPTQNNDVYCIAMDPALEGHILVAWHSTWVSSAASGISESFDGGDTWDNILPPTEDWGTGHAVFFLGDSDTWLVTTQVDGVWRTEDGGDNWTQVETENMTHGATDCLTKVGSQLFLALEHHVYESTDDGETWTDITSGLSTGSFWSNIATDGFNLYTAPSFPIAGSYIDGPWYTRPVAGGTWEEMTGSPDTTYGSYSNGPRQSAHEGGYVYAVNYLGGVWRLVALEAVEAVGAVGAWTTGALAGAVELAEVAADGAIGVWVTVGVGGVVETAEIEVEGATGSYVTIGVAGVIEAGAVEASGAIGAWATVGVAGVVETGGVEADGAIGVYVTVGVAGEVALDAVAVEGAVGSYVTVGVAGAASVGVVAEGAVGAWVTVGIAGVIEGVAVVAQGAVGTWATVGVAGAVDAEAVTASGAVGSYVTVGVGGEVELAALSASGAVGSYHTVGLAGEIQGATVAVGAVGIYRTVGVPGVIQGVAVTAAGAVGVWATVGVAGVAQPAVTEAVGAVGSYRTVGIGGDVTVAAVAVVGAIGVWRTIGRAGIAYAGAFGPVIVGEFLTRLIDTPRRTVVHDAVRDTDRVLR